MQTQPIVIPFSSSRNYSQVLFDFFYRYQLYDFSQFNINCIEDFEVLQSTRLLLRGMAFRKIDTRMEAAINSFFYVFNDCCIGGVHSNWTFRSIIGEGPSRLCRLLDEPSIIRINVKELS